MTEKQNYRVCNMDSDIKITLKVGGPDKLAEGICAWRQIELRRRKKEEKQEIKMRNSFVSFK